MFESVREMRGARTIVEESAALQPDEDVVIVTDWEAAEVAERIAAAARERDANVTMTLMDPREHEGNEPPDSVAAAMYEATVVFVIVSRSISHSDAVEAGLDSDRRWIMMTQFAPEQLIDGAIYADFEAMQPKIEAMADRFSEADSATVTSPQGTEVHVGLSGREGNAVNGLAREPGGAGGPGAMEANVAPVEGTTEGTVVVDGAIPDFDIGALSEPITLEIEDGAVTDVEGGVVAEKLRRVWEGYDDPGVYNVAQLAVGMNPEVTAFDDHFITAHCRYGNVHFGIGKSTVLGGTVEAPVHFDVMLGEADLELDGELVVENGRTIHV
ncbi:aminopeptidase [Natronomonas marina]|jgi:2,5-dihydroxypyridine 5,6-dioxygenase|uniref:aminopeptidase n=1 Tax=Natronomonas marina TaxID=2961939 RepID=UPI0020C93C5E|nr:hypothetical protein [Natronomonas marina]